MTILFFLGYWFTDAIIDLVNGLSTFKPIIVLVALAGVVIYFLYRFARKPMVTGNPTEMPPIVGPVTEKLENVAESMADKVLHRSHHPGAAPTPPADNNGQPTPAAEEKKEPSP